MLFLPLGVDEATLERKPYVALSIAALCVVAFFITWVLPSNPEGVDEEALGALVEQSLAHPDLQFPAPCADRFLSSRGQELLAKLRAQREAPEEPVDVASLQGELDTRCEELLAGANDSLLRRLSLVPSRGLVQPGWLTYMFLHYGWMHLLGNLLFFYVAGLLLEDAWGRPLFAGFYVAGGLAAAIAHFALEPSSQAMMGGASGAVAACMGAFCLRFSQRRVRIGYFIWFFIRIWRGTFTLPGWAWAGLWFGNEVLDFVLWGNTTGVAVMAHIGGFLFGFGAASLLKATRLEERVVAPALAARQGGWVADPRVAEAQAALDRGDREEAGTVFGRVLADAPDNTDALLALGRMELEDGKAQAGLARVERALNLLAGRGSSEALWHALEGLGTDFSIERLRPAVAWRVAQALDEEEAPPLVLPRTEALYAVAGNAAGTVAVRALLRAAELRLELQQAPERARDYVARAKPLLTGDAATLAGRVREVEAKVEQALEGRRPREEEQAAPAAPAPQAPPAPPRIIPCRILGLTEKALSLEAAGGQRRTLSVTEVLAVAVGLLPAAVPPGAPPRQTALTDLVVSWGGRDGGPVVLRVNVAGLGLPQLYPGVAPRDAYARLLADLLERSGANALPDAASLKQGKYPQFASEAELSRHYYGEGAAAA